MAVSNRRGRLMARPVVVFQHGEITPPGRLVDVLAARGVDHRIVRLYAGEALPDPDACAGIVSLGGVMSAWEEDEHPFLRSEKRLLRAAVDDDVPVLGICLGSQLLADALGGSVFRGPRMEAGFSAMRLKPAGREDPVVASLSDPVFSFHRDTWDPPPGARVLAESAEYLQAFRVGSALALQFHAEAPAELIEQWVTHAEAAVRDAGVDPDALVAEARRREGEAEGRGWELFEAWVDHAGLGGSEREALRRRAAEG